MATSTLGFLPTSSGPVADPEGRSVRERGSQDGTSITGSGAPMQSICRARRMLRQTGSLIISATAATDSCYLQYLRVY